MATCYYKILGISIRSSQEDIKRAFRSLALRWHPDRNPHDPCAVSQFREALEAYETLVDPSARGHYDRMRGYGKSRKKAPSSHRMDPEEGRSASLEEVFEQAFGIHLERGLNRGPNDLRFDLQVSRSAALQGVFEEIEYQRLVFCRECLDCGRVVPRSSCGNCHGTGEVEESCSLRIWIPPGSEEGKRLRIPGAGDRLCPGSQAGDLIVVLYVV